MTEYAIIMRPLQILVSILAGVVISVGLAFVVFVAIVFRASSPGKKT